HDECRLAVSFLERQAAMSFTGFTDTSGGSGTSYSPPSRTPDSSPDYSWDDDTNSTNGPTGAYDTPAAYDDPSTNSYGTEKRRTSYTYDDPTANLSSSSDTTSAASQGARSSMPTYGQDPTAG